MAEDDVNSEAARENHTSTTKQAGDMGPWRGRMSGSDTVAVAAAAVHGRGDGGDEKDMRGERPGG